MRRLGHFLLVSCFLVIPAVAQRGGGGFHGGMGGGFHALSWALASPTGLITAQDGVIPIRTTVTPMLTRLIRIPMFIRTHLRSTGMRTANPARPPARKQMENRFI